MIGIYSITNIVSGQRYVGGSIDILRRKSEHFSALNSVVHCNPSLQADYDELGEENFHFLVLEELDSAGCLELREQFYLDNSLCLYNHQGIAHIPPIRPDFSNRMKQVMASPEIRSKISSKMKQHFSNPENVSTMIKAVTTPEVTEKKRQKALQNHKNPEYIAKRNAGIERRKQLRQTL